MIDGISDLPSIVAVPVYDTKPINFLLMCCNTIKWVQKTRQVYEPKTQMVRDAHFLRLYVNGSYNYNMNLVDLSDKLWNVYQVDHWMRKYNWWWSILFWGHSLVLVNDYIIYKTLYE